MESKLQDKPRYKFFTKLEHKPYFAAYLNTAKTNLFIILRDISEKLGLEFNVENDGQMKGAEIWEVLENNNEPELSQKILTQINSNFPFIESLVNHHSFRNPSVRNHGPKNYKILFIELMKILNDKRNYYSHFIHDEKHFNHILIDSLQKLFDSAIEKTKKKPQFENIDFSHLELTNKLADYFYSFKDKNEKITEKGLAFFICLWLERKDAHEFLKGLFSFKDDSIAKFKATLEVFKCFCLKLPEPKLKSNYGKHALLMDMINELPKCPFELFNVLDVDKKNQFRIKRETQNINEEIIEDEENNILPFIIRKKNRFLHYFAIRYMEPHLKNYKFQIDLGRYCYRIFNQRIDEIPRFRRMIKNITSFGNLCDFDEQNRPEEWRNLVKNTHTIKRNSMDVYVTDNEPEFHTDGNNIGLKFFDGYENLRKNKLIWPNLEISTNEIESKINPHNEKPDCWLSLYELPAVLFYQILRNKNENLESVDSIIRNHIEKMSSFFRDIENENLKPGLTKEQLTAELEKRNLNTKVIPKAVINFLLTKQKKEYKTIAEDKIENLIKLTDEMIQEIRNYEQFKENNNNHEIPSSLKIGNVAKFLAKDIILFQKPILNKQNGKKEKGKPNSLEYKILQAKIANFEDSKFRIYSYLKDLNIAN